MHSKVIATKNPEGYVHIEDARFSLSLGGIRLIKGITKHETELLARAMSLKLHSFMLPISGAKSGINSDNIEDLYQFVAKPEVKNLIEGKQGHQYIAGPDIGTSEEEYSHALRKVGLGHLVRPGLLSQPSKTYGLPMDNIVTAWGVIVATRTIGREILGKELSQLSIALEGFGKVGTGIAKILESSGRIMAVSTRYGSIHVNMENSSAEGLDLALLLELQKQHGDKFVFETNMQVREPKALFSTHCDIIIPGARTEVITREVARQIIDAGVKAIVPVSNYPYTKDGLDMLENAGVLCFPDFLASAGAVIAAMIEFAECGGQKEAMDLVERAIIAETMDLLKQKKGLYQRAVERAQYNKLELVKKRAHQNPDIASLARSLIEKYHPSLLQ